MNQSLIVQNQATQFLIYKSDNQDIKVDVLVHDENIWLTQEQMAQLFGKAKSTINEHIKNIFKDGELIESEVIQKFGNSEFQQKHQTIIILILSYLLDIERIVLEDDLAKFLGVNDDGIIDFAYADVVKSAGHRYYLIFK